MVVSFLALPSLIRKGAAMSFPPVVVKVYGKYACFTRPEQKIERVSYEVMTPSAARGVLEAIYWHPPMHWRVRQIAVLKPIRHFSILRNEVTDKMKSADGIDISANRSQRHTLGLRDVSYLIRADVWLPPGADERDYVKHRDQFRRRVEAGQCWQRPYLGCREFAADFCKPVGSEKPLEDLSADLGRMLLDVQFREEGGKKGISFYAHSPEGRRVARGSARPIFFDARLEKGVLVVPQDLYETGDES